MKKIIKDSNGNLAELVSISGFIPEGWVEVSQEELSDSQIILAKRSKMDEIRSKRDLMLVENDKQWIIKSKKGESTTALENEAEALRDLPETAQAALDEMDSVEDIQNYDAFEDL